MPLYQMTDKKKILKKNETKCNFVVQILTVYSIKKIIYLVIKNVKLILIFN